MYKKTHIPNKLFLRVWDAPGTLPDHPGWILGQNIEVKNKSENRKSEKCHVLLCLTSFGSRNVKMSCFCLQISDPEARDHMGQGAPDRALFGSQAWSLAPGFPGPYGPWPLGSRPIFARQKHDICNVSSFFQSCSWTLAQCMPKSVVHAPACLSLLHICSFRRPYPW